MKILVVDDSKLERKMISSFLEEAGHEIETASNGEMALKMIEEFKPEVMTIDLLMPVLDGFGVLKKLKEIDEYNIFIIVVSADIQKSALEECLSLGAHTVINKPIKKDLLQKIIQDFSANKK